MNENIVKKYELLSATVIKGLESRNISGYYAHDAKEALETGKSVYNLVLEHGLLSKEQLDELLDPKNMLASH